MRQGGAKSDNWTSVKEGGSEKTSEQQKNSANDDQPNTNVVFYKVRQTLLGFAVTKAIIGLETSSSQSHSMFKSPPMDKFVPTAHEYSSIRPFMMNSYRH